MEVDVPSTTGDTLTARARNLLARIVPHDGGPVQCNGPCTVVIEQTPGSPLTFTLLEREGDEPLTLCLASGCSVSMPADGSIVVPCGQVATATSTLILSAGDPRSLALLRQRLGELRGGGGSADAAAATGNAFDAKTESASSHMYFHYYGMLQHQQNMLQDGTRTGAYYWAIMNNAADFAGKVVVDVGAGSGILSLFAAQAGAAHVYAVEASAIVRSAQRLFDANGAAGARITLLHGKLEALRLPDGVCADVLISEPMGTLLVNERMLETYVHARRTMLRPGGKMFPTLGRIWVAAFSDAALAAELTASAAFWANTSFYGVDLSALHSDALEGYHGKVVIDAFDPGILVSTSAHHVLDFAALDEADLLDIRVPLSLVCRGPATVHGLACWFDVLFPGSAQQAWLSTAPGMPPTHWFQLRCVLRAPLEVVADGQSITGEMRLTAHAAQSYDIHVDLSTAPPPPPATAPAAQAAPPAPQRSSGSFDLKDPYYRQLRSNWWPSE